MERYLQWQSDVIEELRKIRRLLEVVTSTDTPPAGCPSCGSTKLEDTSTAGGKRATCLDCGKSAAMEATNG